MMRKRLRKKISKYRCLKCGSMEGIRGWYKLKTGRWVPGPLACVYCDVGIPREGEK